MNYNTTLHRTLVILLLALTAFYLVVYATQPDSGLSLQPNPSGWFVEEVEACSISPCPVLAGDVITRVNNISFEDTIIDRRLAPFTQKPGDKVVLQLQRGAESIVVDWTMPHVNSLGLSRLLALVYIAPFILAAGFMTYQVPDTEVTNQYGRSIFILALMSFTLFLVSGLLSFTALAWSSLVFRTVAWLQVGLMLELHWETPSRLGDGPLPGRRLLYLLLGTLALMELFQLLPRHTYYWAYAIQTTIPGLLLFWRVARGIDVKPSLIMLAGMGLSFLPAIVWMASSSESSLIYLTFVSAMLLVWPFFYIYANYRKNLSVAMEKMGKQWIVVLSFTCLSGVILALLSVIVGTSRSWTPYQIVNNTFMGIAILILTATFVRPFENFVDSLLYGQSNKAIRRMAIYLAENLTSLGDAHGLEDYATSFCDELGICESAIYAKKEEEGFSLLFSRGDISEGDVISLGTSPCYLPSGTTQFDWARVSLPLLIRGTVSGYWLLGARQDDDFYPPNQIANLQLIASGLSAGLEMRWQRDSLEAQVGVIIAQERMAALGRMAASIAHQINNPLQVLSGSLEAYGGYGNPGLENPYLIKAYETALYLGEIVSSITLFIRPGQLKSEIVDVNASVQTAVMLASERLKEQKVEVNLHLGPSVQAQLTSPSDLVQVLTNMIDNACDAMNGNGRLTLETGETVNDVTIRVQDNGSGMTREQVERVFEPFFTTKANGSGFGLALAYSIIERNNGKITVDSEPDKGSSFEIIVPKQNREESWHAYWS